MIERLMKLLGAMLLTMHLGACRSVVGAPREHYAVCVKGSQSSPEEMEGVIIERLERLTALRRDSEVMVRVSYEAGEPSSPLSAKNWLALQEKLVADYGEVLSGLEKMCEYMRKEHAEQRAAFLGDRLPGRDADHQ